MDSNLYWYSGRGKCPFDETKLGKPRQIFKNDDGSLKLPVWSCPLCERRFIRYDIHHDLIRRFPDVKCRFLEIDSPKINTRKRAEQAERQKSGAYEMKPTQYKNYNYLFQEYSIPSEQDFCECFSEQKEVYQYFAQRYNGVLLKKPPFFNAIDDDNIGLEFRSTISGYIHKKKEKERASQIKAFFTTNYRDEDGRPFFLDDEQALAVAVKDKRVLAAARAGSGKTRTIVAKIVYLMDFEHIPAAQILSLAFNNNVPDEINRRITALLQSRNQKANKEEIARTFHSLAHQIVAPRKVIHGKERSLFIQKIITELKDSKPQFKSLLYDAFRDESFQLQNSQFTDRNAFYGALRNRQYETLNGEIVKSAGEKWIADYLFEHGIKYIYEPGFYPGYISDKHLVSLGEERLTCKSFLDRHSKIYPNGKRVRKILKPDFLLIDYNYVWEHWGIDESNPHRFQDRTESFDMSWQEYHELMDWKRQFWNGSWRKKLNVSSISLIGKRSPEHYVKRLKDIHHLVETSVADMDDGRVAFEMKIDTLLTSLGIPHEARLTEELTEEVWAKQIKRFTAMAESFIDKFEQHYPNQDYDKFKKDALTIASNSRSDSFIKLGLTVLKKYQTILKSPKKPEQYAEYKDYSHDFNQLIAEASQRIVLGKADDVFSNYRFLFIDEYQDFSELFYNFVRAILSRNPQICLFCVGDTWQAINRFMGADTCFFEDFSKYFSDARFLQIRTNYRSSGKIVMLSNRFMANGGFNESPALASHNNGLECYPKCISDDFIALTDKYSGYAYDQKILALLSADRQSREASLYLKRSFEIINKNRGSTIFLLNRTNEFAHFDLGYVERQIRSYLKEELDFTEDEANMIEVKTMHKAKGLQADIVIILEANERHIPKVHPDNDLYQVFGETQEKNYADEERLFYVAITRAKKQFWILYDGEPSVFISQLR